MNQQLQGQRTLGSLRIAASTVGAGDNEITFTVSGSGGSESATVFAPEGELAAFHGKLTALATEKSAAGGGFAIGRDQDRVVFDSKGYDGGQYQFVVTVARGEGASPAVAFAAPVSDAALDRLVAQVGQLASAGEGTLDWAVSA
ncbi:hypothetical protein E7V67_020045 [[Empedobacter] haloabium]|uniref:Uncharacterized protein n=1 Tax=[Empedobacter] haloabium TaxID=592317 RepID=A0ABZ1UHE0_9BURK